MVEYNPFSADVMENPYPVYAQLREEAPVYYMEQYNAWAISRFQDIWDASSDPRYSAASGTTSSQVLTHVQPVTPMLNLMDPPEHTQLRVAIRPHFARKAIRDFEPRIRALATECLDKVVGSGECDAMGDFSSQVSVKVACTAIGIPLEDGDIMSDLVWRFFGREEGVDGMTQDGLAAAMELNEYFINLQANREKSGGDEDDVVNLLRRFEQNGRKLAPEEIASHLSMLIIGGSETFPKTFANIIYRLWEHPDQRNALKADPSLIPEAFREGLRYDMPTQFLCRTLVDDVEMGGQTMKKGAGVCFLYASANRDSREFENPDVFDIQRRPPRILSFGAGTHACIGLHVAQMEAKVCIEETLKRIPDYEVDVDRAERLRTEFVQGFWTLPLKFKAA